MRVQQSMVTQGELWNTPKVGIKYRGCRTLDNMQHSITGTLSSRGASANTRSKRPFVVSVPISGTSEQTTEIALRMFTFSSSLFSSLLKHIDFKGLGEWLINYFLAIRLQDGQITQPQSCALSMVLIGCGHC
ncbi:hypothetical protein AVEN_200466-1 [Araneus ventricosus]|uniref:Uncharacterized protein n=1 Tax=Araneus ventricosus TaxID=182803 RepID=A0A4Y2LT00_ARAVE|nr:hypothetical protein AVEN_200466-1 [Araneus ventricosus]